jgi:hypothetical protein
MDDGTGNCTDPLEGIDAAAMEFLKISLKISEKLWLNLTENQKMMA